MFTGHVIIVTGAAGKVVSILAALHASRNAPIAAVNTPRDLLEALTAGLSGGGYLKLPDYDLTDPVAAAVLIAEVQKSCGHLNSVGTTAGGSALVGIGSPARSKGGGEAAAYSAIRSAMTRLTESLTMNDELRIDGIRVNAVLPTAIDTPRNRAGVQGSDASRWVQPSEVAEAMAFLVSGAARGVTRALPPVG